MLLAGLLREERRAICHTSHRHAGGIHGYSCAARGSRKPALQAPRQHVQTADSGGDNAIAAAAVVAGAPAAAVLCFWQFSRSRWRRILSSRSGIEFRSSNCNAHAQVMLPAQLKLIIAFTAAISWHAVTVYVGLWVAQGVPFIAGAAVICGAKHDNFACSICGNVRYVTHP
jgi:hypothetical protein